MRQTHRRRLFLAVLRAAQRAAAREGRRLTWQEDPEGITVLLDGAYDSRVSWAELVAGEQVLEADPTAAGKAQALAQLQRDFDNDGRRREERADAP